MSDERFRFEWADGYFAMWFDPARNEVVWWGADHPKGCHPYEYRVDLKRMLERGMPAYDSAAPTEQLAAHIGAPTRHPSQELFEAAHRGDLAAIEALLAEGVAPDAPGLLADQSPLDEAIARQHDEAAARLLACSATLPRRSLWGFWLVFSMVETLRVGLGRGVRYSAYDLQQFTRSLLAAAPLDALEALAAHHPWWRPDTTAPEVEARLASDPAFARWVASRRA